VKGIVPVPPASIYAKATEPQGAFGVGNLIAWSPSFERIRSVVLLASCADSFQASAFDYRLWNRPLAEASQQRADF